jgi:transcriptional regulator with XRE-family HTH domain
MAQLAGTSQSAIAAYEAGDREPSVPVPVLKRMLSATGHRLILNIEPDTAVYRIADLATDISQTDIAHSELRLRLVSRFLRGAQDDEVPAALLGAIAEDLCVHNGVIPPTWALRDADDIRLLLKRLDVSSMSEVLKVVAQYLPDNPLSDQSHLLLQDILLTV